MSGLTMSVTKKLRRATRRCSLAPLLLLLLGAPLRAEIYPLEMALEAALNRASAEPAAAQPEAGSWLAGLPSISLAYYDSQESQGTDEAEVILALPFKSPTRRRLDNSLSALDSDLEAANSNYLRWVYSGLVRERAWAWRLAEIHQQALEDKRRVLETLNTRIQRLAEGGAVPAYQGLIVQRQLLQLALDSATVVSDVEAAQAAFAALTGNATPPANLSEPGAPPDALDYSAHPALQWLERGYAQQQQLLALNTPANSDWTLGVVARDFDSPAFSERQFGLTVEVPLNFAAIQNAGNLSARRVAAREYQLERDQLALSLRAEWEALQAEAASLRRREAIFDEAEELADRIQAQLERLDASSELESELLLQRMLDVLDTRAAARLNQAQIGRNGARLRQVAGTTLGSDG